MCPRPTMILREATVNDIPSLVAIEKRSWKPHLQANEGTIRERILRYPQGQYVVELDSIVRGVLYTQRIRDVGEMIACGYSEQESMFDPNGEYVQLMAINVPAVLDDSDKLGNAAAKLRSHALQEAAKDKSIVAVVAMTRCSAFETNTAEDASTETLERYVYRFTDPTIFFHVSGGAHVRKIVHGYRPEDYDNLGSATLINYDLEDQRKSNSEEDEKRKQEICTHRNSLDVQQLMDRVIEELRTLIDENISEIEVEDQPLMNFLDSMKIQLFHKRLEIVAEKSLSVSFLFKYPTLRSIKEYFSHEMVCDQTLNENEVEENIRDVGNAEDGIAIVGVAFKLPSGIDNFQKLYDVKRSKISTSSRVPLHRFDVDTIDLSSLIADPTRRQAVQWGNFIEDIDMFDNEFFGINPEEVKYMDPNQRLILETVASACVDSGMDVKGFRGDRILENEVTGMYVGASPSDFENVDGCGYKDACSVYAATGSALSVVAGRVSYLLGFRGPSMVTDTACSSSLVVMHQACTDLRLGKCSKSIVAGINLILTPWMSVQYARAGMTSADGVCHTFDESANGYSRGEGCVAMVLKRLKDAQRQGDEIYAVIRGSAVMQDGKSASLTAPNTLAQIDVIRRALVDANVHYRDVGYIEAHGTGTILGDPIEIEALKSVYCRGDRKIDESLVIGSLKANVGHLEAAAGFAGILSVILSFRTGIAFPNGQLQNLNKKISDIVRDSSIIFPRSNETLRRGQNGRLLAGVNSFGYSGTIAHAILEEVPEDCVRRSVRFIDSINSQETKGNNAMPTLHSCTIRQSTTMPTISIDNEGKHNMVDKTTGSPTKDVIFQFRGQGILNVGSGSDLFTTDSVFRSTMLKFEATVRSLIGVSITSILYPDKLHVENATKLITETRYSQPILIALECSLADMWISKGVVPRAVLGHSIGEYAACYAAGVLSIEDTARLVCKRGELTQKYNECRGSMVALIASAEEVTDAITRCKQNGTVTIAAVNGKNNLVISGSAGGVDLVLAELAGHKHFKLPSSYAFHSPMMACILPEYSQVLGEVQFTEPTNCDVISTVTGTDADAKLMSMEHWLKHITNSVQYQQAIEAAWRKGGRTFIEIGPEALVLTNLGRSAITDYNRKSGSLLEQNPSDGLWLAGIDIYSDECEKIVHKYSRSTILIDQTTKHDIFKRRAFPIGATSRHDILQKYQFDDWKEVHRYSGRLHDRIIKEIAPPGCSVDTAFFPVLSILEVIIAAAVDVTSSKGTRHQRINGGDCHSIVVHDFVSTGAMEVMDSCNDVDEEALCSSIRCSVTRDGRVDIYSDTNMEAPHATADIVLEHQTSIDSMNFEWPFVDRLFADACADCKEIVDLESLYSTIPADNLSYNSSPLVAIDEAWVSPDRSCCVSSSNIETGVDNVQRYEIPPDVLRAIQDTIFCLHPLNYELQGVERVIYRSSARTQLLSLKSCKCIIRLVSATAKTSSLDCMVRCLDGTPLIVLNRINIIRTDPVDNNNANGEVGQFWNLSSEWIPRLLNPCLHKNVDNCAFGRVLIIDASESGVQISPQFNRGNFTIQNVLISSQGDIHPDLKTLYNNDEYQRVVVFIDGAGVITCNNNTGRITKGLLCLLAMICDGNVPSLDRLLFVCNVESGPITSSSLYGLLQTARLEFSRVAMSMLYYKENTNFEGIITQELSTKTYPSTVQDTEIFYEGNECFVRRYCGSENEELSTALRTYHQKSDINHVCVGSVAGGTYIITGGLGALGLVTAKVLAKLGAKRLVLLSRSGVVSNQGQGLEGMLTDLQDNPQVSLHVMKCDVSMEASVTSMLCSVRELCTGGEGIDGIIHSAGLLRDAIIHDGKALSGFDSVWSAKALSSFWLHKHTKADKLKSFVVYSTIVTAVGHIGQSAYGAANAFMDGLIEERVHSGLAGCSIRWPAISNIGMAAATAMNTEDDLLERSMPPSAVEAVLEKIFTVPPPSLSEFPSKSTAVVTIFPDSYTDILSLDKHPQLMNVLAASKENRKNCLANVYTSETTATSKSRLRKSIKARDDVQSRSWTDGEIEELAMRVVTPLLFGSSVNSESSIDRNVALMSCGLDSLGTTELSCQLSTVFGIKISPALVFECPTLDDIVQYLKTRLSAAEEEGEICSLSISCISDDSPFIERVVENRYFHAIDEGLMGDNSVGMISLCRWSFAATELLENAVKKLLQLNPILMGCIDKGTHALTGQTGLCVEPHRYSLDSIFSVVHLEVDAVGADDSYPLASILGNNDHVHDSDLEEMMAAVSSFYGPLVPELGNGWDQKRNKSRLFAVTVIKLPMKDQVDYEDRDVGKHQDYAIVHITMSHAIGDGYTYYKLVDQLNQLMKEGHVTTPLRWNEPIVLLDSRAEFNAKSFVCWSSETADVSHCCEYSIVDTQTMEEAKRPERDSDAATHLTLSDVIISSIANKMKLRSVFVAINTRNLIDGLAPDLAGDFNVILSVDVDPTKTVSLSEEMFKLTDVLDGGNSRNVLSQDDTVVSDLTSITSLLDIPVTEFELLCHLPYHRTRMGLNYEQAFIFKANAKKIAIVERKSSQYK